MEWDTLVEWWSDQLLRVKNKNFVISHINNRSTTEYTCNLLKYEAIHGNFDADKYR